MASEAERYLRGKAVDRLRELVPDARIVHELNVEQGYCRVDVAAIGRESIVFVEIKSRKDKLDRLGQQVRVFRPCCHELVVCYSAERWDWSAINKAGGYGITTWADDRSTLCWTLAPYERPLPGAAKLLNLLWKDELVAEASRAGLDFKQRWSRLTITNLLARNLTGIEAVRATCRQLRGRSFVEADPALAD